MIKNPPASGTTNFTLNMKEVNNYFPFGMKINSRTYTAADYSHRYGFNGMTEDNELKGEGNSLDFGARFYDPRVGRFLSLDPMMEKFPWQSPYMTSSNNPINYIDVNGEYSGVTFGEKYIYNDGNGKKCINLSGYFADIWKANIWPNCTDRDGCFNHSLDVENAYLDGLMQVKSFREKNPDVNLSLSSKDKTEWGSGDFPSDLANRSIEEAILIQTIAIIDITNNYIAFMKEQDIKSKDILKPFVAAGKIALGVALAGETWGLSLTLSSLEIYDSCEEFATSTGILFSKSINEYSSGQENNTLSSVLLSNFSQNEQRVFKTAYDFVKLINAIGNVNEIIEGTKVKLNLIDLGLKIYEKYKESNSTNKEVEQKKGKGK